MRLAVIIALLTLSVSATAQSFRARIIDSETGKPVLSASIQYDETGIISDSSGIFTIDHPKYPLIISISHINYHPRDLVIQSPQESGMDIEIIPKTIAIDVIEIVGERVKRFFEKQYFYISDYLILDKNILLIGYEKGRMSKGVIAMTNYSENAFATSYIDNPKSLFRDVFGQVFLFANDSVYQVFFDGDNFNLLFPQLAGNFPQEMFKIQCMLDEDNCVMKEAYENRQLHKYRKFNFVTQKFTDIANIYDKSTFKSVAGAANHRPATGAWDLDAWINELYQNRYIYKPVISESFSFQDGLIIFDLTNHFSYIYDKNLQQLKKISNTFPEHAKYEKHLIKDKSAEKFYWVYHSGHQVTLHEIDVELGSIKRDIQIPPYPFIENIQVHNGDVWFLYQPKMGEKIRSLFRLRILREYETGNK